MYTKKNVFGIIFLNAFVLGTWLPQCDHFPWPAIVLSTIGSVLGLACGIHMLNKMAP